MDRKKLNKAIKMLDMTGLAKKIKKYMNKGYYVFLLTEDGKTIEVSTVSITYNRCLSSSSIVGINGEEVKKEDVVAIFKCKFKPLTSWAFSPLF